MLTARGLRVTVVNAVHTKNVPGRKTDVQECQWLMKLHAYGLLRDSFHTPRTMEKVRTVWRVRDRHVKEAGRTIQHMQKALTAMNVQLSNVLSDLSGVSGQAIIRAILRGERDPYRLADLCHARVQATREEVARSLEGLWRDEVLFELQQAVESYDFTQHQLQACDQQLQQYLGELPPHPLSAPGASSATVTEPDSKPKKARRTVGEKKARGNAPQFDLRTELTRIAGVDLTTIDGIDVMTAQTILAELGPDLSAFATEDRFTSWLGLCPRKDISGGKVIGTARTKVRNRVAIAFRNAAMTLKQSKSFLGARYRHLQLKLPSKTAATKAMARYLAILVYRLMRYGQEWVDRGMERFEAKRAQREMAMLESRAKAKGFHLVPIAAK
ncbi:IS110 family transposase [uncultured Paludibaculum sp.]|uniref:IS110 family transposase n=1 Tax=uncultured Paludibaculum sp. TaxID=1765020 RepID=UPI002AAAA4E6|nr:IS110 family transposase [uncultured Paludibaculum sp.]